MYCFLDYLEDLSGNFCAAKCEEVISRFQEHYGANMPPMNCPQFLVSTESHISNVLAETNARLVKVGMLACRPCSAYISRKCNISSCA